MKAEWKERKAEMINIPTQTPQNQQGHKMVTFFRRARQLAERQTAAVLSIYHSLPPSLSLDLLVQSDAGSLFMCKFALRPYEGGAHAESLFSGL